MQVKNCGVKLINRSVLQNRNRWEKSLSGYLISNLVLKGVSNYRTVIIGCITAIIFIATGIVLFKGFDEIYSKHKKYTEIKELVLNTDKMKSVVDSIDHYLGIAVIGMYLYQGKNTEENTIPCADLFICRRYADSLSVDTIIVLDTKLMKTLKLKYNVREYGVVFEPSRKLKKCRVMIPARMIDAIKKYKYAYENLEFSIDD